MLTIQENLRYGKSSEHFLMACGCGEEVTQPLHMSGKIICGVCGNNMHKEETIILQEIPKIKKKADND